MCYWLTWFCFFFSISIGASEISIKGQAALLMNGETGHVLFQVEGDKPSFPASTTKISTALYALTFHEQNLDDGIIAESKALGTLTSDTKAKRRYQGESAYNLEPDGTHISLKKGEELPLRNLLEGLLIASGNDAANVIAQELGPTIPVFMQKLNAYLKTIGCQNTHYTNPHGLHDPSHITTAYDLALMTREALKNPLFCQIVAQTQFVKPKTNKQPSATFLQGNRLLRSGEFYYDKAIGVKTGYHSRAKRTFVGAARSQERTLILVLLGYSSRQDLFKQAKEIFEWAFNQPKITHVFLQAGDQTFNKTFEKATSPLQTYLKEPLSLDFYALEDPQAKCFLKWENLSLPIEKNQKVGDVYLADAQGAKLQTASLYASQAVGFSWPYSWIYAPHFIYWIMGLLGLGLMIFWFRM